MGTILSAVGAAGNWTAGSAWVGGVAPTAADDAVLQATTTSITINSGAVCRSLVDTAFTGTITHNAAATLTIGDGTAGASNKALDFGAFTYTLNDAATSAISFISTSSTVQTVNFNGKTTGNVTYAGVAGSWQLTGTHNTGTTATVTLTNGTLDTNGQTCSWGIFSSSNSNTRVLTLGASGITMTGAGGSNLPWSTNTVTNLTFNANTSTITFNASNANIASGALTYNNVVFTTVATAAVVNAVGNLTFNNLTKTCGAITTDSLSVGGTVGTFTVTGTLTLTGNSLVNRLIFRSNTLGTTRTITAAVATLTNCDFEDIVAAGAASPWTGTSMGDAGGNTSITTDTPVTRYWVGNGGSWNSTTHWSTTTGGASGASVPLVHDTNVFDANSITSGSQTITYNVGRTTNVDFSNVLNSPIFAQNSSGVELRGNIIFKSGMTTSGSGTISIRARDNYSVTTNSVSITFATNISVIPAKTFTFADNYTCTALITYNGFGTFTVSGNVSCPNFVCNNSNNRTLNMGSGTWTLTGTGVVWNTSTVAGLTVNGSTASVSVTDTSSSSKTIDGRSMTLLSMAITGGGTGAIILPFSSTYTTLTVGAPKTINFTITSPGLTVGTFNPVGSVGNIITLQSTTGGSQASLTKTSGTVIGDYLSIQDSSAKGGASFYAGANSTNVSNNNGWQFSNKDTSKANFFNALN